MSGPRNEETVDDAIARTVNEVNASGLFGEVLIRRYPWSEQYTADRYVKLMHTYSDHRVLDPDTLHSLCAGVRAAIEGFGGVIERHYEAVLYVTPVNPIQPGNSQ
jgi:hypothetical protein